MIIKGGRFTAAAATAAAAAARKVFPLRTDAIRLTKKKSRFVEPKIKKKTYSTICGQQITVRDDLQIGGGMISPCHL